MLRPPTAAEAERVQAVWKASLAEDDPGAVAGGGWSVDSWATAQSALLLENALVGVAAVRAETHSAEVVEARVALALEYRRSDLANLLIQATVDLACDANAAAVRLFSPAAAAWALTAARAAGFRQVRSIFHMLLPARVPLPDSAPVPGVHIRSMRSDEDDAVLAALNRNWEGTWSFVPIRPEMLESDLEGQRDGMLLAINDRDRIVATCHAVFDRNDQNPDGDARAWISNLTVDPEYRGRGLGRAMLVAGLRFLRERGAGSITLGVDAGDPTPLRLYQSVGFETISSTDAWDKPLR